MRWVELRMSSASLTIVVMRSLQVGIESMRPTTGLHDQMPAWERRSASAR